MLPNSNEAAPRGGLFFVLVVASRHCEERSNLDELRPQWTKGSSNVLLIVG